MTTNEPQDASAASAHGALQEQGRCDAQYTFRRSSGMIDGCQCVHEAGHEPPHECEHGNDWGYPDPQERINALEAELEALRLDYSHQIIADHNAPSSGLVEALRNLVAKVKVGPICVVCGKDLEKTLHAEDCAWDAAWALVNDIDNPSKPSDAVSSVRAALTALEPRP